MSAGGAQPFPPAPGKAPGGAAASRAEGKPLRRGTSRTNPARCSRSPGWTLVSLSRTERTFPTPREQQPRRPCKERE